MSQIPRRIRDLGIVPGVMPTGPLNAITDVPGVRVGQVTIDDGADLQTGVTAIVPAGVRGGLPAAIAVGNGYGKLVGATQVDELGVIETPVLLTGTLSVFRVADALLSYLLDRDPDATSLNPVVGETNDGYLSGIRRRPITDQHVYDALASASADLPAEGCVGAGTGTAALGFKGGIGTSSRVVEGSTGGGDTAGGDRVSGATVGGDRGSGSTVGGGTVGALVQSNFSGLLTVLGVPVPAPKPDEVLPGNSCMIVVATDLPLDARQLGRLARRAVFALGLVGSDFSPHSGDYAIAFSTAPRTAATVADDDLRQPFRAATEAVEEALLNSLTMAHTVTGFRSHTRSAVSHADLMSRLTAAGRLPGV